MKSQTRCPKCLKPLIPGQLTRLNKGDHVYILCPWCSQKLFLPLEPNGGSNPELGQHVKFSNRNPETGRFEKVSEDDE